MTESFNGNYRWLWLSPSARYVTAKMPATLREGYTQTYGDDLQRLRAAALGLLMSVHHAIVQVKRAIVQWRSFKTRQPSSSRVAERWHERRTSSPCHRHVNLDVNCTEYVDGPTVPADFGRRKSIVCREEVPLELVVVTVTGLPFSRLITLSSYIF